MWNKKFTISVCIALGTKLKIILVDAGISGSGNMKGSKNRNKKESIIERIKEVKS